jgi:hypothetical protein
MSRLEKIKTVTTPKFTHNTELISLYNKLDTNQKLKFCQRFETITHHPILVGKFEENLNRLNKKQSEELFVYSKILLIS